MHPTATYRQFSHVKCLLLLAFVLNLHEILERRRIVCIENFANDLRYFHTQHPYCEAFFPTLEYDEEFWLRNVVFQPHRWSNGQVQVLKSRIYGGRIISKYPQVPRHVLEQLKMPLNVQQLSQAFFASERLGSLQFCPATAMQPFVDILREFTGYNETTIWLYMLVDPQPILMPFLAQRGFPVPATYATCGFTLFQQHVGRTLTDFRNAHFVVKLQIAQQLLDAVLRFTYGFAGFRMYLTDLTSDNLVYNEQQNRLYFIDLDAVFVLNANATAAPLTVHRQLYTKCSNCFAYEPSRFCRCGLSDMNLLSACAFLRDDARQNRLRGFLYPIPMPIGRAYPNLSSALDACVGSLDDAADGQGSMTRFEATVNLIAIIKSILLHFYNINCDLTN